MRNVEGQMYKEIKSISNRIRIKGIDLAIGLFFFIYKNCRKTMNNPPAI